MTNYEKCPYCGAVRMLYQAIDGEHFRTCFACYTVQKKCASRIPTMSANRTPWNRVARVAFISAMICSLVAGPVWAEQVVLDGQEFRAHVERDKRVQEDRDNLEQQNALYRKNERNYKAVVQQLKELQAKMEEKSSVQESLIQTYDAQRVQLVRERQEFADEARRVKKEQAELTWKERGASFAAGVIATGAVVAVLLRGGR